MATKSAGNKIGRLRRTNHPWHNFGTFGRAALYTCIVNHHPCNKVFATQKGWMCEAHMNELEAQHI